MVNASGDPVIEAAHIWSDTLTVLLSLIHI